MTIAQLRNATSASPTGASGVASPPACDLLPERDDREQADDADRDDRALEQPGREVADRQALMDAPDDREEGDAAADEPEDVDELEDGPQGDLLVGAGAQDVGGVVRAGPTRIAAAIEPMKVMR